jgi:hypothetical protein
VAKLSGVVTNASDIIMTKRSRRTAAALIPHKPTLPALRAAAAGCKACDLWKLGTQTVFGERLANSPSDDCGRAA